MGSEGTGVCKLVTDEEREWSGTTEFGAGDGEVDEVAEEANDDDNDGGTDACCA